MKSSPRAATEPSAPATTDRHTDVPEVRQYSRAGVLAVWAAAALPMGLLAWVVTPAVAGDGASPRRFTLTLIVMLMIGLIWQAMLVLVLVAREGRDPDAPPLRDRLWLRAPRTETRRGGRLWWWIALFAVALAVVDLVPFNLTGSADRDPGAVPRVARGPGHLLPRVGSLPAGRCDAGLQHRAR